MIKRRYSFKFVSEYAKNCCNLTLYRHQRLGDRANYYYEFRLSDSDKVYTSLQDVMNYLRPLYRR